MTAFLSSVICPVDLIKASTGGGGSALFYMFIEAISSSISTTFFVCWTFCSLLFNGATSLTKVETNRRIRCMVLRKSKVPQFSSVHWVGQMRQSCGMWFRDVLDVLRVSSRKCFWQKTDICWVSEWSQRCVGRFRLFWYGGCDSRGVYEDHDYVILVNPCELPSELLEIRHSSP